MRTSLNDIRQTEAYLDETQAPDEKLVFEARLITQPLLRLNMFFQQKIYRVVRAYHRRQQKEKMESVHRELFSDPAKKEFQQNIRQLFP